MASAGDTPYTLVISSSEEEADGIVKKILDVEKLPVSKKVLEDVKSFSWYIDNKYYQANVEVCATTKRTIGNEDFANAVEAVIIHFDGYSVASFDGVKMWMDYIKHFDAAVLILLCDKCKDESQVTSKLEISREKILEWCIDNSFELVELTAPDDEEDDVDGFGEIYGFKRVIQALNAHTWSNLELKSEEISGKSIKNGIQEEIGDERVTRKTDTIQAGVDHIAKGNDDSKIAELLGEAEAGEESFEKLFENMNFIKEKADSLQGADRRAYAEQVALSFWKAIGGDENEIAGLSDSD